jgi:cyclase
VDVKKKFLGKEQAWFYNGQRATGYSPVEYAQLMEQKGAGELIVQSIDRDGMMNGYDLEMIREVSQAVTIPIVALGGAGSLHDMRDGFRVAHANAMGAGSMFVYHGARKGVLINYPTRDEINVFFKK